jgi:lipopolysaccharide transport system permease protein
MADHHLIIEAGKTEGQYWRDIWRYRELLYFLAWRDILVRYKQTVVGVSWAFLRPFLTMVVFTFVFGHIAGLSSEGIPYPILVLAGILPWQFFSNSLSESSSSLTSNVNLISKVYFPRLILPTSSVVVAFVDFAISFLILAGLMAYYSFWPTWRCLLLPGFIMLAFFAALGPGLLITALNVRYRDFRYVVPFIVQMGLYISPVGFSSDEIPTQYRFLYSLNPVVGVIDGFRWSICDTPQLYMPGFLVSLAVTFMMLWAAIVYFRRTERTFADVI